MKKIQLWDHSQNYYWGEIDNKGDVKIYGHNGIYIYGKLFEDKFELFDKNHDFIWGELVNGKDIQLWRRSNHDIIWGNIE